MGMTIKDAVGVLSSAADGMSGDVRSKLLVELRRSPQSVGQLAAAVGQNQPLVSHHLNNMERAGVAMKHRDGRSVIYAVNTATFTKVAEASAVLAEAKPLPTITPKVIAEKTAKAEKGKKDKKAEKKSDAPKVEVTAEPVAEATSEPVIAVAETATKPAVSETTPEPVVA